MRVIALDRAYNYGAKIKNEVVQAILSTVRFSF
jgi:hypothetical protein